MLKNFVIGVGQAGNKCTISLVENGIIGDSDYILINSTDKDIPNNYKYKSYIFQSNLNGCGKERDIANQLFQDELAKGTNSSLITKLLSAPLQYDMITVISSTEGGTGSGISPKLATWLNGEFYDKYNKPVHIIGLLGFESDPKGMENTISWMNELDENLVIHMIDNKKFLEENKTISKAENAANTEVGRILNIVVGKTIVKSDNRNIDDTDLLKIISQPGYLQVLGMSLDSIESKDDFNSRLKEAISASKYVPTKAKCYNAGIIINAKPKTIQNMDESFKVAFDYYGTPYESFPHYQDIGGNETIEFIFSAMDRPAEELKKLISRYDSKTNKVDFSEDDGFKTAMEYFKAKSKVPRKRGVRLAAKRIVQEEV